MPNCSLRQSGILKGDLPWLTVSHDSRTMSSSRRGSQRTIAAAAATVHTARDETACQEQAPECDAAEAADASAQGFRASAALGTTKHSQQRGSIGCHLHRDGVHQRRCCAACRDRVMQRFAVVAAVAVRHDHS